MYIRKKRKSNPEKLRRTEEIHHNEEERVQKQRETKYKPSMLRETEEIQ